MTGAHPSILVSCFKSTKAAGETWKQWLLSLKNNDLSSLGLISFEIIFWEKVDVKIITDKQGEGARGTKTIRLLRKKMFMIAQGTVK